MPTIKFLPGNGEEFYVNVEYWAEFPRDNKGLCAFCHGDPVPDPPKNILHATPNQLYMLQMGKWFETCPVCLGKPS